MASLPTFTPTPAKKRDLAFPSTPVRQCTPRTDANPSASDRFIPSRGGLSKSQARMLLASGASRAPASNPHGDSTAVATPARESYRRQLNSSLLDDLHTASGTPRRILQFGAADNNEAHGADGSTKGGHRLDKSRDFWASPTSGAAATGAKTSAKRGTPLKLQQKHADLVLDAPEMPDNFYLNLLDWSSKGVVAIGLGSAVHVWNSETGAVSEVVAGDSDVTSVAWADNGAHLAVGFEDHAECVQLWAVEPCRKIRDLAGHSDRVSALHWGASYQLATGSRDTSIITHDVRAARHAVTRLRGVHRDEVCGLRFAPISSAGISGGSAATALASGGNDNLVAVWDLRRAASASAMAGTAGAVSADYAGAGASGMEANPNAQACLHRFAQHQAAVKALAWCPSQRHMLATGGGSSDKSIKLWNAQAGSLLSSTFTGSQVTGLSWGPSARHLISAHGYTDNAVCVWAMGASAGANAGAGAGAGTSVGAGVGSTLLQVGKLTGHRGRILHMAVAPDRRTVATAAADETLRVWKLFGSPPPAAEGGRGESGMEEGVRKREREERWFGGAGGQASEAMRGSKSSIR
ncbi:hypothetical protein CLOM_g20366 [Closterium sp. NIES-68]|nr:hypothetical protein CLOM_g20366 [Closterium sp. NIES-68]GJP65431.1 hypothetical protein CLOP_g22310 [Closterium sp. NIES-67]